MNTNVPTYEERRAALHEQFLKDKALFLENNNAEGLYELRQAYSNQLRRLAEDEAIERYRAEQDAADSKE